MKKIIVAFMGFFSIFSCVAQKVDNTPVSSSFNLSRYLGTWYEIARFDHRFERGIDYCKAQYILKSNGKIEVLNTGKKNGKPSEAKGKAKTTDNPAILRVSFFGPFYSDYRILLIASDYSYALVGSGSADYLWILSRTPQLSKADKDTILAEATRRGYDTKKLIWVKQ